MSLLPTRFRCIKPSALPGAMESLVFCAFVALFFHGTASAQTQNASPLVADRVIVVVNQQVILQSDLDREIRLSILDPNLDFNHHPDPALALEHLISRTLIRQQFANQPLLIPADVQQAVDLHLQELRTELPECVRLNCSTPGGWQAFLNESNLTAAEIDAFLREQVQILDFIEKRFQPGIHISRRQVAEYYKTSLLPQYTDPSKVPALESIAPRITEILLEKQVNLLLEDWLAQLRKEGEVEILDPALVPATPVKEAAPIEDVAPEAAVDASATPAKPGNTPPNPVPATANPPDRKTGAPRP